MPTASGPNTLGESNLVFAYDTGDTVNSYRGEPTTNLYTTLGFGFYQQEGNHTAARTVGPAPNLNLPSNYDYTTITTTGNWQAEVNRIIIWTNTSLTSGTYNISFWARVTSTSTATMGCAFYGNNINNTMSLTNQWQRFSIQSTTHPLYRATEFGSLSGAITFQIAGLQIESVPHATQYVNGIRSATQGLLPVIGNSTIDLSNVSFDSSAKMVFDGTDDYIEFPTINLSGDFTIAQVANLSATANGPMPIGGGYYANGSTYQGYMWFRNNNNQIRLAVNGELVVVFSVLDSLWVGKTIYYAVKRQGTTATLYIDGIEVGSGTISTNNFDIRTVGYSYHPAYASQGNIPVTKIYNRALTAQEIQQNYQQYKTRFNLS